jgi:hypothetical protein
MSLPECYKTSHSSAMNKISGRLREGREFIMAFDPELSPVDNSLQAFQNRWYGNVSERKSKELTSHFQGRYYLSKENFNGLKQYLSVTGGEKFPWINHFYMLLNDIYYRWASSEFLSERYNYGLLEIPRSKFNQELKKQLPDTVGDGSVVRYAQNLLTALRDNGILEGVVKKQISSPVLNTNTLAYMLYSLSEWEAGGQNFDNSPLYRSLLKPKEFLVPIFLDGERMGYWDFTGDKDRLRFNLNYASLSEWINRGLQ